MRPPPSVVDVVNAHSRDLTALARRIEELEKRLEEVEAREAPVSTQPRMRTIDGTWSDAVTDVESED